MFGLFASDNNSKRWVLIAAFMPYLESGIVGPFSVRHFFVGKWYQIGIVDRSIIIKKNEFIL